MSLPGFSTYLRERLTNSGLITNPRPAATVDNRFRGQFDVFCILSRTGPTITSIKDTFNLYSTPSYQM